MFGGLLQDQCVVHPHYHQHVILARVEFLPNHTDTLLKGYAVTGPERGIETVSGREREREGEQHIDLFMKSIL